MTTATDYYFINAFGASEQEINELGECFGVSSVYNALNQVGNREGFTKLQDLKATLFLWEVGDILAEDDIFLDDLGIDFVTGSKEICLLGLPNYLRNKIDKIAEKSGITIMPEDVTSIELE